MMGVAKSFVEVLQRNKQYFLILFYLFFFFYVFGSFSSDYVPSSLNLQKNYITQPENCLLLTKGWTYTINNQTQSIDLPKFDQPSQTLAFYEKNITLNESFKKIELPYVDDEVKIYFDGNFVGSDQFGFGHSVVFYQNLSKGNHTIKMEIYNRLNVGGLGQVLLCKE